MLLSLRAQPPKEAPVKKVPVIIIMADQLRADALGRFTPNINALKEDGIDFTRTYCACPLCAPSRAAFFTGRYPDNTGALINGWAKEDEHYREVRSGTPNLYQAMGDSWDSWHIGKQHFFTQDKIDENPASKTRWVTKKEYNQWLKKQDVRAPGGKAYTAKVPELISDEFTILKSYSIPKTGVYKPGLAYFFDQFIADSVVSVIREHGNGDKPLLINAMFLSPHPPLAIPEPYYSKIKQADLSIPENVGIWYDGQSPLQMYNLTGFIGSRYSREQWSEIWPKYLGLVSLLDDEVGRILKALKDQGLYDKALIIFTSDHGEMLGSHDLWQKMCMYEESARVPLIIKFPSDVKPAVHETDALVSLIDVWPTLMDFLNIKAAGPTDGISLMPLVKGQKPSRDRIFIQYDGNGAYGNNQRCVVDRNMKLIVDTFKDEVYLELYDEIQDPMEKNNLALNRAYQGEVNRLLDEIRGYMKDGHDALILPPDIYKRFMQRYSSMVSAGNND